MGNFTFAHKHRIMEKHLRAWLILIQLENINNLFLPDFVYEKVKSNYSHPMHHCYQIKWKITKHLNENFYKNCDKIT